MNQKSSVRETVRNVSRVLTGDKLGRDLLVRALSGFIWSASAAAAATLIAAAIGIPLGLIAADRGGVLRALVKGLVTTITTLPGLIIAIIVVALIAQGWAPIVLTLGLLSWPVFARVTMLEAQSILARDFIPAARLAGMDRVRILITHVAPNLRASLLVLSAIQFADMLIAESALSFLGLAAPLGAPTWGNMLADSRAFVFSAPWMLLVPAGAIIITVVAANLLADGLSARLRDEF
jgi:peptide/nickel transport system permease protein